MKLRWWWVVIVTNLGVLVGLVFLYPKAMVSPGPLLPAHAAIADSCASCHTPWRGATASRCITCHVVADIGLRTTTGAAIAPSGGSAIRASFHQELLEQDCTSCHSDHQPTTQRTFSHSLLRPATREACAACHVPPGNELHDNLSLELSCSRCHSTQAWSPATFDHSMLDPATLEQCQSCHRPPTDDLHRRIVDSCSACHSPLGWRPSILDHSRFFVLDRDHNTTCATCHTNNDFSRYSCYGCHEHTPSNIRAEHEEEGIRNFENCVSCHRSADEDGREGGGRGRGRGDDDD